MVPDIPGHVQAEAAVMDFLLLLPLLLDFHTSKVGISREISALFFANSLQIAKDLLSL